MKRKTALSASANAENSSSSIGSSNSNSNSLTGRPPFLSNSITGNLGRRFHAASHIAHREGQPALATQSLNSTLGLFPRAGASAVHNNDSRSWQLATADSVAAPQPDKVGDVHVKIKTRDATSMPRRTAVQQSSSGSAHLKASSVSELRRPNTLEATVQSLRASAKVDTATHRQFSHDGSADAAARQPRTMSNVPSQMPQMHLSPISEVTNASFSSASFPREFVYDGSSDDGSNGHDSALYVRTSSASHQEVQAHPSSDQPQAVSRTAANFAHQPPSPVQREASPIHDALHGDTLIANMDALIADPAPMQVLYFCVLATLVVSLRSLTHLQSAAISSQRDIQSAR
jgi:hypothetical protein